MVGGCARIKSTTEEYGWARILALSACAVQRATPLYLRSKWRGERYGEGGEAARLGDGGGAFRADRRGGSGIAVGGADVPAAGVILGSCNDAGGDAVVPGSGAKGFVAA